MPTLPNAKHERFAQALADGKTQFEAHGIAGYNAHRSNASKLAQDKYIVARLTEILAERENIRARGIAKAIETVAYGIIEAMAEAEEARQLAIETKNAGAAVAAVTLRSKLNALLIDRKEIRTGALDAASDDELDRIIRGAAAEAQVSLGASREGSETKH